MINIENKTRSFQKDDVKEFSTYLEKALELLISKEYIDTALSDSDADISVDVRLVGEDAIRKLNAEYREKDRVTDVLSFPILDMTDGKLSDKLMPYDFSYVEEKKILPIGDVVICPEKAKKQAEEYGHSMLREMVFLAVHSFLHLLGFDHENGRDEECGGGNC